jgi:hypothetical protein
MTLLASRQLAQNQMFQDRVRVALVTAAVNVLAEDAGAANHAARASLESRVLMGPGPWGTIIAESVAVNTTIAAKAVQGVDIPDDDIQFVVNGLIDAYAGKAGAEP